MSEPTIRVESCRGDGRCPECGEDARGSFALACGCCVPGALCVMRHLAALLAEALRQRDDCQSGVCSEIEMLRAEVERLRHWREDESASFGMSREVCAALREERDAAIRQRDAAIAEHGVLIDLVDRRPVIDPKLWPTKTNEGERDWYVEARTGSANYRGDCVRFVRDWYTDRGRQYTNEPAEDVIAQLLEERDAAIRQVEAQRHPCPCGKDSASIKWARCYSCRQKEAEERERIAEERDAAIRERDEARAMVRATREVAADARDGWAKERERAEKAEALLPRSADVLDRCHYRLNERLEAPALREDIEALLAKIREALSK